MKYHRPLVNSVCEALQQIFENGLYADKVVEQTLKQNSKFGSRDRRFIAETIYEIVRWKRLIEESSVSDLNSNNYLNQFATWQVIKGNELPPWDEFANFNKSLVLEKHHQLQSIRKVRESIPDWLDELGLKELGEKIWEKEIHELNKTAKVVLRVNTLKTTIDELEQKLIQQGIAVKKTANVKPWSNVHYCALVLEERKNLETLPEYKLGHFEIQDAGSQLIAPFLEVEKGMSVIDACAGAGGKTLHIADIMKNKGKIIAMDIENKKLNELNKRAERAGVNIIETHLLNPQLIEKYKNYADRLLLDVPCSGLGVLKRNPDAKWKLNLNFINNIKNTQQEILNNYSKMLKPGGIMVYATCSILPGENKNQVELFLNKNKSSFKLLNELNVFPSLGFDGFYMASIIKA